jgi:hypothetical protein
MLSSQFLLPIHNEIVVDLIGYSRRGWQDAENGKNKLHPAAWALFLLATWQHPSHQVINSKDSK